MATLDEQLPAHDWTIFLEFGNNTCFPSTYGGSAIDGQTHSMSPVQT